MNNDLLKLLSLSQENNDRLVIYNLENPEKSWVAVSLKDYQKLLNNEKNENKSDRSEELTTSDSGDKIESIKENDNQSDNEGNIEENSNDDISGEELNGVSGNREVYSDPNMPTSVKDVLENKKEKWEISRQVKNSATEVIE
ncbi:MAG TPA: hypothetical protein VJ926_03630 [Patescibacteria group bacterium]|nr:hypothetical protein [Patescibacteria group bacterium]